MKDREPLPKEPFSLAVYRCLCVARCEAERVGFPVINSDHFLLGLLSDEDIKNVLRNVFIEPLELTERIRSELVTIENLKGVLYDCEFNPHNIDQAAHLLFSAPEKGEKIPLSICVERVFENATRKAHEEGVLLTPSHLLIEFLDQGDRAQKLMQGPDDRNRLEMLKEKLPQQLYVSA